MQVFKACGKLGWKDINIVVLVVLSGINVGLQWGSFSACNVNIPSFLVASMIVLVATRGFFICIGRAAFKAWRNSYRVPRISSTSNKAQYFIKIIILSLSLLACAIVLVATLVDGIPYLIMLDDDTKLCLEWEGGTLFWNYIMYGVYYLIIWVCIIFICAFLFFFLKSICRRRFQEHTHDVSWHSGRLNEIRRIIYEDPDSGIPIEKINQLQKKKASELEFIHKEKLCSICIESFEISQNDISQLIPCNHYFHYECLSHWLVNHKTCPMCRCDVSEMFNFPAQTDPDDNYF